MRHPYSTRAAVLRDARRLIQLTASAAVMLVVACGPTETTTANSRVERIDLSVPVVSIYPGNSVQAVATPRDESGNAINLAVTWSSTAPTVATVSQSGLIFTVGIGLTTITATAGGQTAHVTVNVTPTPDYSVSVSPGVAPTLTAGDSMQFTTLVTDLRTGAIVHDVPVTWFATGPGASVAPSGLLHVAAGVGLGESNAVITASVPGKSGSTSVVVHINDWEAYRPSASQSGFMLRVASIGGSASLTVTCDPVTRLSEAYVLDLRLGYTPLPVAVQFSGDSMTTITTWTASEDLPIEVYPRDARPLWMNAAAHDTLYLSYIRGPLFGTRPDATFLTRGLRYYTGAYLGACN